MLSLFRLWRHICDEKADRVHTCGRLRTFTFRIFTVHPLPVLCQKKKITDQNLAISCLLQTSIHDDVALILIAVIKTVDIQTDIGPRRFKRPCSSLTAPLQRVFPIFCPTYCAGTKYAQTPTTKGFPAVRIERGSLHWLQACSLRFVTLPRFLVPNSSSHHLCPRPSYSVVSLPSRTY